MSRFGAGLISSVSGGNDHFTKALLHFDGTPGSTTFTDDAPGNSNTWVASGSGPVLADSSSGGFPKFGATYLLSGALTHIYCAAKPEFNLSSQDFTIDFWWWKPLAGVYYLTGQTDSGATFAGSSFYIICDNAGKIQFTVSDGSSGTSVLSTTSIAVASVWRHIAATRNGNVLRLFIDGIQEGGDVSFTWTVPNSLARLGIFSLGSYAPNNPAVGVFDEYRLSIGIARWTSNFVPPAMAYS